VGRRALAVRTTRRAAARTTRPRAASARLPGRAQDPGRADPAPGATGALFDGAADPRRRRAGGRCGRVRRRRGRGPLVAELPAGPLEAVRLFGLGRAQARPPGGYGAAIRDVVGAERSLQVRLLVPA